MQHEIDDRLARAILSGQVRDGQAVRVDVASDGDALALSSVELPPAGFGEPGVRDDASAASPGGPDDDVIEAELLDD